MTFYKAYNLPVLALEQTAHLSISRHIERLLSVDCSRGCGTAYRIFKCILVRGLEIEWDVGVLSLLVASSEDIFKKFDSNFDEAFDSFYYVSDAFYNICKVTSTTVFIFLLMILKKIFLYGG